MGASLEDILKGQDIIVGIVELLLLLGPIIGFIYGFICCCRRKTPLFNQLVVAALGCMMLSRLYEFVIFLTTGSLPESFNLSVLGDAGGFLFLLSASFGQMDGLVDDRKKENRKYRLIPLIAPLLIIAISIALYLIKQDMTVIFFVFPVFLVTLFSSYYNLKHLIFPDVELGILKSIRSYNGFTLFGTFSYILLCFGEVVEQTWIFTIGAFFVAFWYILVFPVLKGGSDKWTL